MFKKAFTLAEIMIVLVIIGVITAILLPVAINSAPDENVMKFKKGNNTLGTVIRELVNSDRYYSNGDLGIKANGDLVDSSTYFCETFSDIINIKSKNCIETNNAGREYYGYNTVFDIQAWPAVNLNIATEIDSICSLAQNKVKEEIISQDDIIYFEAGPGTHFGISSKDYFEGVDGDYSENRYFLHKDSDGFYIIYKIFCMDIDGIDKGEEPFGYGIRVDGKIYTGARVTEWMQKSVQKGD